MENSSNNGSFIKLIHCLIISYHTLVTEKQSQIRKNEAPCMIKAGAFFERGK